MTLHLTPVQVLAALGGLLALVFVWRASSRAGRRAAEAARTGVRLVSLAGRVVLTAAVIVAVQWIAILQRDHPWILLAVLACPALLASYTLTRALTVTTVDTPRHRSGRR